MNTKRRDFLKLLVLGGRGSALERVAPWALSSDRALFEPPDGRVYHGVGEATSKGAAEEYIAALGPELEPLIEKRWVSIPGTRGVNLDVLSDCLEEVRRDGRIIELSIAFQGVHGPTDVEIAETSRFDSLINGLAEVVRPFQPLFVRPGFEFNGPWNGYTPVIYVAAYRKIVDRFRAAGVQEAAFIWCYEPDAPDDFDAVRGGQSLWYPGDEYVDWFGHDVFRVDHFDPRVPDIRRGRRTPRGKTERFLQMARRRGKPVFLSEAAAWFVDISPDDVDPDHSDGRRDWAGWFRIFFDWLAAHPEIKALCYLNEDWTRRRDPDQARRGNARIDVNTYILERYREEMRRSRYIHKPEGLSQCQGTKRFGPSISPRLVVQPECAQALLCARIP